MGVLVTTSQMLIWVLYILTELYSDADNFHGHSEPVLLSFMFIFGFVAYEVIPFCILYRELTTSINDTSTSDSHELLMEANNESKPFLDKFDFESLEGGTLYDSSSPNRHSTRMPRPSESSLEQMLALGRNRAKVDSDDEASIATTRSFIRSLGGEDSNTEVELFRARAASAFCASSTSSASSGSNPNTTRTPLYADKLVPPRKMSTAIAELSAPEEHYLLTTDENEEEKDDDPSFTSRPLPLFPAPVNISRSTLSPTRVREMNANLDHNLVATVPDNSRSLTTYAPPTYATAPGVPPLARMGSGGNSTIANFLRKRSVAPLKARNAPGDRHSHSLSEGMNQVAAVTSAALDPNKVLPMLMKLGVSSVEAAGMMTYLMRMKELSEGKKKKNSLAMVV